MFVVDGRQRCSPRPVGPAGPGGRGRGRPVHLAITLWLWFTVLFANFAEAMAEGRGKAQADALRGARHDTSPSACAGTAPRRAGGGSSPRTAQGRRRAGRGRRHHPGRRRGDRRRRLGRRERHHRRIAPVIRESGGDRSAVTGGTRVLSDWLVMRVTANPGETFLDRMIAMVEGAKRQKTPNEIALTILLAADAHLPAGVRDAAAVLALQRGAAGQGDAGHDHRAGRAAGLPDPDHHRRLLSAIGIAGMDRMIQRQRHRHVGPRGRGGRRRRRAAARQDRHHHAGQPQATEFLPRPA
jgi:potassium-transporting ATPase ATP-binding subunit